MAGAVKVCKCVKRNNAKNIQKSRKNRAKEEQKKISIHFRGTKINSNLMPISIFFTSAMSMARQSEIKRRIQFTRSGEDPSSSLVLNNATPLLWIARRAFSHTILDRRQVKFAFYQQLWCWNNFMTYSLAFLSEGLFLTASRNYIIAAWKTNNKVTLRGFSTVNVLL